MSSDDESLPADEVGVNNNSESEPKDTVSVTLMTTNHDAAWPAFGLTLQDVTIYEASPAILECRVDGRDLRIKLVDFYSRQKFWRAFVNAACRYPNVTKDDAEWQRFAEFAVGVARRVDQPPDASRDAYHREVISTIIDQLPSATTIDDLNAGRAIEKDGKRCFKTGAIAKRLADRGIQVEPAEIAVHLRKLGAESSTERFPRADRGADDPKDVARVWVIDADAAAPS
jgi:hypothetical protein